MNTNLKYITLNRDVWLQLNLLCYAKYAGN